MKKIESNKRTSLPLDNIEVMKDELIFVCGGNQMMGEMGTGCGCECGSQFVSGIGCGCGENTGTGCGCGCAVGIGCGCLCDQPTMAID